MNDQISDIRFRNLAGSLVLIIISSGCGGVYDDTVTIAEAAAPIEVSAASSEILENIETSKKPRKYPMAISKDELAITASLNTEAIPVPTTTTSITRVTEPVASATTNPNTSSQQIGQSSDASTLPAKLLQQTDLLYVGAFQLPKGAGGAYSFSYGGTALAFNAKRNSLIIRGNISGQYVAEVSIPTPALNITKPQDLPAGMFIQGFSNTSEGKLSQINSGDPNGEIIGGHYIYKDRLLFTGFSYYDAQGTQNSSHFSRPLDFTILGQVDGPYKISSQNPRYFAGYMASIPVEWQSSLGGKAFSGLGNAAIASQASVGPSALVFDPDQLGAGSAYVGNSVLYYPLATNLSMLFGTAATQQNDVWNIRSNARGAAFPAGTSTILFFGVHGSGPVCYGTSSECYDPVDKDKGYHAYPYSYQIWAYNAFDLLDVKNGKQIASSIKPYGVWKFNLPYQDLQGNLGVGGVAFDEYNRLLYISQPNVIRVNYSSDPVIHVFRVN
jgi:hypothetical protein